MFRSSSPWYRISSWTEYCSTPEKGVERQVAGYFKSIQKALDLGDDDIYFSLRRQFQPKYSSLCAVDDSPGGKDLTNRRMWLRQLRLRLALDNDMLPPEMKVKVSKINQTNVNTVGGFADIFQGVCNGHPVALKRFRTFRSVQHGTRGIFYQECLTWWNLAHPNVLCLLGVDYQLFPERNIPCIVTPWMKRGNIRQAMENLVETKTEVLELTELLHRWIKHVTLGLAYLHTEGIIHGDLRGVNILIKDDDSACVAGFGFSAFSNVQSRQFATMRGGADPWLPPEIFDPSSFGLSSSRQTVAGDIYAFSCVCIELYTGEDPWSEASPYQIPRLVLKGERPQRPYFHEKFEMGECWWELVQACWAHKATDRPNAHELVRWAHDIRNPHDTFLRKEMVRLIVEYADSPELLCQLGEADIPKLSVFNAELLSEPSSLFSTLGRHGDAFESSKLSKASQDTILRRLTLLQGWFTDNCVAAPHTYQLNVLIDDLSPFSQEEKPRTKRRKFRFKILRLRGNPSDEESPSENLMPTRPAPLENEDKNVLQTLILTEFHSKANMFPGIKILDGEVTPTSGEIYGDVCGGMWQDKTKVALKILREVRTTSPKAMKRFEQEMKLWLSLSHPNLLQFLGIVTNIGNFLQLVSPWQDHGNVLNFVNTHPTANRIHLLAGASLGLTYLHTYEVVHGNLRCSNILVSSNHEALICEFGMSEIAEDTESAITTTTLDTRSSARWVAPEFLAGDIGAHDKRSDVYSFGMTMYECLTGNIPFPSLRREAQVIMRVVQGGADSRPKRPIEDDNDGHIWMTDSVWDIVTKCWDDSPQERPEMEDVSEQLTKIDDARRSV